MAMNSERSMNQDLHSGVNDGRLKNLTPDRGGQLDMDHVITRSSLLQNQYDITDMLKGITPSGIDYEYENGYAED